MSLAGSRGGAPCGVWGNAPTVARATNSKEAANKGAGSEASLPVTSRSRRSAPSRFIHYLHIVASDGRDRIACLPDIVGLSRKQGVRACGRDQRAFRSPFGNLRCALPCFLTCIESFLVSVPFVLYCNMKKHPRQVLRPAGDALIFPYLLESVSSFTQPRRVTSFA